MSPPGVDSYINFLPAYIVGDIIGACCSALFLKYFVFAAQARHDLGYKSNKETTIAKISDLMI